MSTMNYMDLSSDKVIAYADGDTRQKFIRKTYFHLTLAIAIFALLVTVMFQMGLGKIYWQVTGNYGGFALMGIFFVYGIACGILQRQAENSISILHAYMWWGIGIVIASLAFLPLIALTFYAMPEANILRHAAVITLAMLAGLTAIVFFTGKDFSFLRPAIFMGFFVMFGIFLASFIFGFDLGLVFFGVLVILSCGLILYETSKIQYHYHETQYVGASLALFASVGVLFLHVIQFLMSFIGNE